MANKKRAALIVGLALAAGCSEPSSDSRRHETGKRAEVVAASVSAESQMQTPIASATANANSPNVMATKEVAGAAEKFLVSLDEAKRKKVLFEMKDDAQRKRWSNLPAGSFPRAGLRMGDLSAVQRDGVLAMLKAALSAEGYEKVLNITHEGDKRISDQYYVSIMGKPSETEAWMIQFGGHHLGINITLMGTKEAMAPSHTGAQPARYEMNGKMIRPLGDEIDKAFALMSSLDDGQKKAAIIGAQFRDLVLGPGRDGQMISPEGVKGEKLSEKQREMLLDLAGEWTGMLRDEAAKAKMEEMKKNIAETWFAWSGSTEKGKPAYFRIQGPTVIIEYAPQGLGGDPTNHIHTIYRDPANEYGAAWWKK
jgi:hypothetical protein